VSLLSFNQVLGVSYAGQGEVSREEKYIAFNESVVIADGKAFCNQAA
jgi:hypothetical protein